MNLSFRNQPIIQISIVYCPGSSQKSYQTSEHLPLYMKNEMGIPAKKTMCLNIIFYFVKEVDQKKTLPARLLIL
jgi:hypothetical protein